MVLYEALKKNCISLPTKITINFKAGLLYPPRYCGSCTPLSPLPSETPFRTQDPFRNGGVTLWGNPIIIGLCLLAPLSKICRKHVIGRLPGQSPMLLIFCYLPSTSQHKLRQRILKENKVKVKD